MADDTTAGATTRQGGARAFTVTLPLPDHRLSLNGRIGWQEQRRRQQAQATWAWQQGLLALDGASRPAFPAGVRVMVGLAVERRKGGKVWDAAAVIEACKGYLDGLNGIAYADDRQIAGFRVGWDERPTGAGVVHLTVRAWDVYAPFGLAAVEAVEREG